MHLTTGGLSALFHLRTVQVMDLWFEHPIVGLPLPMKPALKLVLRRRNQNGRAFSSVQATHLKYNVHSRSRKCFTNMVPPTHFGIQPESVRLGQSLPGSHRPSI